MSTDVAHRLYKAALKTPLFHLEDVYLTGNNTYTALNGTQRILSIFRSRNLC